MAIANTFITLILLSLFVAVYPSLPTLKDFESECWEFESLRPHQLYQSCNSASNFLIAFVAVPEFFVLQSYPSAEGLALEIGITHRYIMSGMLFIVVCFAFQSRNVEKVDNQKAILLGAAIGFSAMCAVIISMPVFRGIPLSIPPMIATGTIAALSFWSRSKLS